MNLPESVILEVEFRVTSADADSKQRLRPSALINMCIQAASQHAGKLGYGVDLMQVQEIAWVLSRMQLSINSYPKWNEKVVLKTWPKNINRLFYLRDLLILDEKGNELAKATTEWLMIDIKARRPKLKDPENPVFTLNRHFHAIEPLVTVLKTPEISSEKFTRSVMYNDIDLNQHLTTTKYIDFALDCFPLDFHATHNCTQIALNFNREISIGTTIQIQKYKMEQTNVFLFEFLVPNENQACFRGEFSFSVLERSQII